MPTLDELRTHKQLNNSRNRGENHPKTAYVMLGHGMEKVYEDTVVVPEGCIVVVVVHSGEYNFSNVNFFDPFFSATKEEQEKFLNPLDNHKFIADKLKTSDNENKNNLELINIFTKQSKIRYNSDEIPLKKTVAIYRGGDICPNFIYNMFNIHRNSSKDDDIFLTGSSGLFKLPNNLPPFFDKIQKYKNNEPNLEKSILENYKYSVYPTVADLQTIIQDGGDRNIPPPPPPPKNTVQRESSANQELLKAYKLFGLLDANNNFENIRKYYTRKSDNANTNILKLDSTNIDDIFQQIDTSISEHNNDEKYIAAKKLIIDDLNIKKSKTVEGEDENTLKNSKLINKIFEKTTISQEELFNKVKNKELEPAVFYNVVCRSSELTNFIVSQLKSFNNPKATTMYTNDAVGLPKTLLRKTRNNNNRRYNTSPWYLYNSSRRRQFNRHLGKRIIEAEKHRKQYISGGKTRRKSRH